MSRLTSWCCGLTGHWSSQRSTRPRAKGVIETLRRCAGSFAVASLVELMNQQAVVELVRRQCGGALRRVFAAG